MNSLSKFAHRKRSIGCRHLIGCVTLIIITLLLLTTLCLLTIFVRPAAALQKTEAPLAVWLLIDNSNSMFEKGGAGSDPDLLRIAAARLFIAYLGVDERDLIHQVGVIFFGTTAEMAVPLTPLHSDDQREQLSNAIAHPQRMAWTNHLAALQLAQAQMVNTAQPQRPAIVLLTDGKSETGSAANAPDQTATIAALRRTGDDLAAAGIPLFVILLANEVTDADGDIAALWRPLWVELSAATPPGRFFEARAAADLPGIYHDIVIALTGGQTAGAILDVVVPATGLTQTLPVADNLAQMTLVVSKASLEQEVAFLTAEGVPLTIEDPAVRRAGQPGQTLEEIWVIEQPVPGTWSIRVNGAGPLTIWQDYDPAPPAPTATPTPAPLTPTARAIVSAAATPQLTATLTLTMSPLLLATQATLTAVPATVPLPAPDPDMTSETAVLPTTSSLTPGLPWGRLLAGVLLAGGAALSIYRWQKARRPRLSGRLCLLGAPAALPPVVDLDQQARQRLTIGRPPADVPLPGVLSQATLCTGAPLDDTWEVWLQGPSEVLLNGLPVLHDMPLSDTAVLDFGSGIQARYENLRLRRAQRSFRPRPAQTY